MQIWKYLKTALAQVATVLVIFSSVGVAGAHAQNVLMLATNETAADAIAALSNMQAEFVSAGAVVTRQNILSTAGAVTPATFTASPGPYDVVLIGTVYAAMDSSNWTAVQTAMSVRAANSFVMFVDGCCQLAANLEGMRTVLNNASNFGLTTGLTFNQHDSFPLNTNSPYQGSFSGLTPFAGGYYTLLNNVPAANALYLPAGTVTPPALGTTTPAYGLFVPVSQSFAGAGACLFAVNDISPWSGSPYVTNLGKIAPAFLAAAGSGGACGLSASVSKAFTPTSVAAGESVTLTITVNNLNNPSAPISALNVQDLLPAPVVVNGVVTTTCTGGMLSAVNGTNTVSLSNATLPAAGCTITVPVVWPVSAVAQCLNTSTTVTNTIKPGPAANGGQFNTASGQVLTPATATLTCTQTVPPTVAPVPTLGEWARLLLSSLLVLAGGVFLWRRRAAA